MKKKRSPVWEPPKYKFEDNDIVFSKTFKRVIRLKRNFFDNTYEAFGVGSAFWCSLAWESDLVKMTKIQKAQALAYEVLWWKKNQIVAIVKDIYSLFRYWKRSVI